MRVISALLSSTARLKARPFSSIDAHRLIGRAGDVAGELRALLGDGVEHAAALVGQHRGHRLGVAGEFAGDFGRLAGEGCGRPPRSRR